MIGNRGLDPSERNKNLSFIHFIPAETAARGHMAQPVHEGIDLLPIAGLSGELQQPFAKSRVQRAPLGAGDEPGLLNEVFIGTEGDVFHSNRVYAKIVRYCVVRIPVSPSRWLGAQSPRSLDAGTLRFRESFGHGGQTRVAEDYKSESSRKTGGPSCDTMTAGELENA